MSRARKSPQPFMPPKRALPLAHFPQAERFRIWEQVMLPRPPKKWLLLGNPSDPRPIAAITSRAWYEWHWRRYIDPDARRPPIPKYLREFVIKRDGLVCHICRGPVERHDIHLDHVLPFCKGGPTDAKNLRVSHSQCNMRKGGR